MLDVSLAASLFQAVSSGAKLLLVGDVDQLPSVGPGRVLSVCSFSWTVHPSTDVYWQGLDQLGRREYESSNAGVSTTKRE